MELGFHSHPSADILGEMETWHVVIEPVSHTGLERYVWRINSIQSETGPHELAAFGRARDRMDALRLVSEAFAQLSTEPKA